MIDSHVHTRYSKHARGSIDDVVRAALANGISILTFTDHAPFPVDATNRLLASELEQYVEDIARARSQYSSQITILTGLEADFMPGAGEHTQRLLAGLELDFVIGSIHYIPVAGGRVNVWDLPRLNEAETLTRFFLGLEEALCCGMFDAMGHPDALLRAVPEDTWCARFLPLLPLFARHGVAYELNASGARKSIYDPATGRESHGCHLSYPSRTLLPLLVAAGVSFTIGSDAHDPQDVGAGVTELLKEVGGLGVQEISYYRERRRFAMPLGDLLP